MLFDFEGTCTTAAKLSVSNITKIIMTMTHGLHSSVIEIMEVFFPIWQLFPWCPLQNIQTKITEPKYRRHGQIWLWSMFFCLHCYYRQTIIN